MRNFVIIWVLLVLAMAGTVSAQSLRAQGTIETGPTPSVVSSVAATDFVMTVRNRGAGTFFQIIIAESPAGVNLRASTGRTFIPGGQTRNFTFSITPNGIVAANRVVLELWGESEAGDEERLESRAFTINSIAPPGAFQITFPEFNAVVGPAPFNLNWSAASGVERYELYVYRMEGGARVEPPVISRTDLNVNAFQIDPIAQLQRGVLYQLDMFANNAVGRTRVTNPGHQFLVIPLPTAGPFQITSPTVGALTSTRPMIVWTASENATSYRVAILPEVDGAAGAEPLIVYEGITGLAHTLPEPGLVSGRTYYVSVRAVAEAGERLNDNLAVRFMVEPRESLLSDRWYFAEGASLDGLDTYYLIANPNSETINLDVDFLVEQGENRRVAFDVAPRSRLTIRVNDWVSNTGVSGVVTERAGKLFGAERAMYAIGTGGRWNGATAVSGISRPEPEWFLAEGATSSAGNGDFQTFVLVANPTDADLEIDVTFFPQGGAPLDITFPLAANRRLTIEPANLFGELRNRSFSTRVRSADRTGILVERAMWWRNADWPGGIFAEGNAAPGIPALSRTWYLAEGNTRDFDEFILLVNPNSRPATINLRYLISTAEPGDRTFVLEANARATINVRFDELGLRSGNTHGTMIISSIPIAVERSMYFALEGGTGWVGGTGSVASPVAAREWLFAEGAEFPLSESRLRTSFAVINPDRETAELTFDFLLSDGTTFRVTRSLMGFRRMTLECREFVELFGAAFSTTITSTKPVVAERTMVFGTEVPRSVSRIGATGSLGVPVGPLTIQTSLPVVLPGAKGPSVAPWTSSTPLPTPTPTPRPTPTPIVP